jgi:hypothetical protein
MAKTMNKSKSLSKAKKRARDSQGRFRGDNPKTPHINEAYESQSFLQKNWKGLLGVVLIIVIGFLIGNYNT